MSDSRRRWWRIVSVSRLLTLLAFRRRSYAGPIGVRNNGNLLSNDQGTVTAYALDKASARGTFFSKPGTRTPLQV